MFLFPLPLTYLSGSMLALDGTVSIVAFLDKHQMSKLGSFVMLASIQASSALCLLNKAYCFRIF